MAAFISNITLDPNRAAPVSGTESRDTKVAALSPGSVVQVITRENFQGQSGVFYQGRFIPAELPQQLKDGAKLLVQVQSGIDSTILKILGADTQRIGPKRSEKTVVEMLKELIAELPSETLPKLSEATNRPTGSSYTKLIIQDLLAKLSDLPTPLNAESFENPEVAEKALTELFSKNVTGKLAEIVIRAKAEAPQKLPESDVALLREMLSTMRDLIEGEGELKYPAHLEHLLLERANTIPASLQALTSRENKALLALFRAVSQLGILNTDSPGDESSEISKLIADVKESFQKIRKERPEGAELRAQLKVVAEKIQEFLTRSGSNIEEQLKAKAGIEILESLHQISSATDALRQINTCAQALGEPVLLIIPVVLNGFLSKWQISMQSDKVDDEQASKGKNKEPLNRMTLNIPMPNLGNVGVELAYRSRELLMSLSVENPALQAFLAEKLPKLEEVLRSSGFEKLSLGVRTGAPKEAVPSWYQEVTQTAIVA